MAYYGMVEFMIPYIITQIENNVRLYEKMFSEDNIRDRIGTYFCLSLLLFGTFCIQFPVILVLSELINNPSLFLIFLSCLFLSFDMVLLIGDYIELKAYAIARRNCNIS